MARWLIVGLLALIAVAGSGAYVGDREDWGPNRDAQVISTDGGETIVIERDRGPFPLPFLFIPLSLVGLFLFLGGRRRSGGGPTWSGGPDRFREWHERAHQEMASRAGPPSAQ